MSVPKINNAKIDATFDNFEHVLPQLNMCEMLKLSYLRQKKIRQFVLECIFRTNVLK